MKVFLVDRDASTLQQAEREMAGKDVVTSVSDVSQPDDWTALKDSAMKAFGGIHLLVLNAGTAAKGGWGDADYFRTTLETNLFGVIHGINTFLPVLQEATKSKPTAVLITGSKQGITNPPGNPAYNASKAAVKSLAEHLCWDLRNDKTTVHLLVPGWTHTGVTGGGRGKEKPAGAWAPEQVAEHLHRKMAEDKFYIICPDNDVSEETDKKRILWSAGDIVGERPPLTRWREEWKKEAEETMSRTAV